MLRTTTFSEDNSIFKLNAGKDKQVDKTKTNMTLKQGNKLIAKL